MITGIKCFTQTIDLQILLVVLVNDCMSVVYLVLIKFLCFKIECLIKMSDLLEKWIRYCLNNCGEYSSLPVFAFF